MQYLKIFDKKTLLLPIEKILWLQAQVNYTIVHTTEGKQFLTARTLKTYEVKLPAFIRPNQSSLVNKNYVTNLINSNTLLLNNGFKLSISRRKREHICHIFDFSQ